MSDKNVEMSAGEISERRIVTVQGDSEATQMEVYLEVEVDDKSYGLLIPLDLPVHLVHAFEDNGTDVLEPVDDETALSLKGEVNSAVREWGLKSEARPDGLYLVGDPDDDFIEDCDLIEVRTDDGEEEEGRGPSLQFDTGDKSYLVITPIVPDLLPVEFTSRDAARHLNDAELSDSEETFHAALRAVEDEEYACGKSPS